MLNFIKPHKMVGGVFILEIKLSKREERSIMILFSKGDLEEQGSWPKIVRFVGNQRISVMTMTIKLKSSEVHSAELVMLESECSRIIQDC